jgi:hypothetical protein
MHSPTDQAKPESSINTEAVVTNSGPNMNRAVTVRRKAAKRTLPWDLSAEELHLVPSSSPHAEDIPASKKRRIEERLPTTPDQATTNISSHGTAVSLAGAAGAANTLTDPVKGTRVTWRPEEDVKLNSAVTNTCKKKCGKEYKTDWAAVTALVPSRTKKQCWRRWNHTLNPSIDRTPPGRKGKWSEDEDTKLEGAVQTHGGENWGTIAVLVPGRTGIQCYYRWSNTLGSNINPTTARAAK